MLAEPPVPLLEFCVPPAVGDWVVFDVPPALCLLFVLLAPPAAVLAFVVDLAPVPPLFVGVFVLRVPPAELELSDAPPTVDRGSEPALPPSSESASLVPVAPPFAVSDLLEAPPLDAAALFVLAFVEPPTLDPVLSDALPPVPCSPVVDEPSSETAPFSSSPAQAAGHDARRIEVSLPAAWR